MLPVFSWEVMNYFEKLGITVSQPHGYAGGGGGFGGSDDGGSEDEGFGGFLQQQQEKFWKANVYEPGTTDPKPNTISLLDWRATFKKLALKYHPDRPLRQGQNKQERNKVMTILNNINGKMDPTKSL